jgi:hypothetical protein
MFNITIISKNAEQYKLTTISLFIKCCICTGFLSFYTRLFTTKTGFHLKAFLPLYLCPVHLKKQVNFKPIFMENVNLSPSGESASDTTKSLKYHLENTKGDCKVCLIGGLASKTFW